jgi:hypothetical protein
VWQLPHVVFCGCGKAGSAAWQVPHDAAPGVYWTEPFRCVAVTAVLDVDVDGWQFAHAVDVVCGAGGGLPWHDVQVTVKSLTPFRWSVGDTAVPV